MLSQRLLWKWCYTEEQVLFALSLKILLLSSYSIGQLRMRHAVVTSTRASYPITADRWYYSSTCANVQNILSCSICQLVHGFTFLRVCKEKLQFLRLLASTCNMSAFNNSREIKFDISVVFLYSLWIHVHCGPNFRT